MTDPAVVAAIAAIVGSVAGVLSAMVAAYVKRGEVEAGSDEALRRDMDKQIERLDKRIASLEIEANAWREKYWTERAERVAADALNAEMAAKNDELIVKCAQMTERIKQLEDQVAILLRRRT